jgi:hypothetical protein
MCVQAGTTRKTRATVLLLLAARCRARLRHAVRGVCAPACAQPERQARAMADAAAAVDDDDAPPSALAPLPLALALTIFAQLPVDARARCACVCRGWRAALADPALWTRLDVSRTSGVTAAVTDALLRGAAARAGGALQTLDVSGCSRIWRAALRAVVTAHGGTLRELRACYDVCDLRFFRGGVVALPLSLGDAQALLRAAPRLRLLDAALGVDSIEHARIALRSEGLLAPLRVRSLRVGAPTADAADMAALTADVDAHAWLRQLRLNCPVAPHVAEALVTTALARRFTALHFVECGLSPAAAPALARLLGGGGAVTDLYVSGQADGLAPLLDAPAAALLAGALRANATLTSLDLHRLRVWDDVATAATLLGALAGHPSLRALRLWHNCLDEPAADRAATGAALGALLVANAPALTELSVADCLLRDDGMAPLLQALRANTHLRVLNCVGNAITGAFAADVLLPAVRANGSLRLLHSGISVGEREAEDVVRQRPK